MNTGLPLRAQQQAFAALLTADAPDKSTLLLRALGGRPARVDVYHHAYRARLIEALRSNFPVLHRVLGDKAFAKLGLAYLADHPSQQPSIRWFGDALPAWAAAHPDALPHPALADLAAMEWALGTSFDAADATPLAFADLASRRPEAWPAARFAPHPSVALVSLAWAVEPIWQALTLDDAAATGEPEPLAHRLLVWRQGLETRWRSLADNEAALIAACLVGEPFAALCERAIASQGDAAPAWVAGALRRWVDDGLLVER
ncbi:DNA-binding domain-containing protein [Ideonella sp.]|uniref:HvfC/BufC N-terminal domain-containing protein n=1 Tax=Ideonella sp. TaxID=1929293 RepID=UPI002B4870FF|nr:putative DNA-binding domain-containing protein [Ideonella sp.]HJV70632.1 putative DNA-binding domain-containing protein [Ideonella sp.]